MINIFNIERFATHDGEGIRTVIFLKGCPLHCPWCANPESWSCTPQISYDINKCTMCRKCEQFCKSGAITFQHNQFHYQENTNDLCELSVEKCPTGALEIIGKEMGNQDIIDIVMKDNDYYQNSGGGVTISGGEPFLQYKALFLLLRDLKELGVNIAIETTGHTELSYIKDVEPYIDTFLFDIKHLDADILKKVTGGDLVKIMTNFDYLVNHCPQKVVIRVPVIPGFNYTDIFIYNVIRLAKATNVKSVHLLPYHTLGKNKWDLIMKDYYSDQEMLQPSILEKYKVYAEEQGVRMKIGG